MITFAMVLLLMVANLVAIQYGGGAVRAAVDEGSRYGAFLGAGEEACEQRATDMLRGDGGLLRGSLGDTIRVVCAPVAGVMRATATGSFEWWIGGLPDVDVEFVGEALIEPEP
jgi:hypothetical protein